MWKSYSEPGGVADQLKSIANANKDVVKLETIGKSVQGKDILAVKVTKARQDPARRDQTGGLLLLHPARP